MDKIHSFMAGAIFMADLVIALLFARFYRRTRDRLFIIFAIAFAVLAASGVLLSIYNEETADNAYLYGVRLLAFLFIIGGILDKNRKSSSV